ncbi:MAG: [FeFe] hydrogenase H-cluster radical SAM maturase HydE [Saccharofermentans sp.]|nr:[FeFe] hydrogenase H-cluster radical SAM maturase HydE [Saccharofermentans sp.]
MHFLAASDIAAADRADDEHLNKEGHRAFARAIVKELEEEALVDKLCETGTLCKEELVRLLASPAQDEYLASKAVSVSTSIFGKDVYLRGLIEFSNYCRNDCYYCGIRASNRHCSRYRMTPDEITDCADRGYKLGLRTFVLQSGEDPAYKTEDICKIVKTIKARHPDCAVTLSIGEKTREEYLALYDAGSDRYLLRHETYDPEHYRILHPEGMSRDNRLRCLNDLKDIGFQTGCGIMIGTKDQTLDNIADDLLYMKGFEPHMVGIGPFLPASNTPFEDLPAGDIALTLRVISIVRLMLPKALIPATTALGTAEALGREKGILAGANVVMPDLSPVEVRGKYLLYDDKICVTDDISMCQACITGRLRSIGYTAVTTRGDHPDSAAK